MRFRKLKKKYKRFRMAALDEANWLFSTIIPRGKIVNEKEFVVVGLMRTGNHAVINWLFSMLESPKCFLNCVEPGRNPFIYYKRKGTTTQFPQTYFNEHNIKVEQLGFLRPKKAVVFSYEDEYLDHVYNEKFISNRDRWVGKSSERFDVLILRDPYNLFASRLKREEKYKNRYSLRDEGEAKHVVSIWKQYAREFLNMNRILPDERILINYNKWVMEKTYRDDIAARLGLVSKEEACDEVLEIGGGSSFGGKGNPSEKELLGRWRRYKDSKEFQAFFKDDELNDLSLRIFGDIPGVSEWLANL